jgi:hypothetical protein
MPGNTFYTWFSRIGGILILLFFLSFFIGEGLPDILHGKGGSLLLFLPFTGLSFAGFFVAWFKPYTGGLMLVAGALVMAGFFIWKNEPGMAFIFGFPSLLIGLSFIASTGRNIFKWI